MTLRKLLACFFVAVLLPAGALRAQEAKPGVTEESLAAARDLMEVTGATSQLDKMIAVMSEGFAKGAGADTSASGKAASEAFKESMKQFLSFKQEMLTEMASLYAETFTAAEMKEVADFYRAGTGAKFIRAMPALMQRGSEIGVKYAQKALQQMKPGGGPPAAKP